jgi:hypothetical protein
MICSKILTLNKNKFVTRLSQLDDAPNDSGSVEYFNIGYPILDPPTLRGSIVALFRKNFIEKNKDAIVFGSPVDTGGIAFGLFENLDDPLSLVSDCKCDGDKFLSLLNSLKENLTPNDVEKLYQHKISLGAIDVLRNFFSSRVVNLIINNEFNPHSLIFEFSLSNKYLIDAGDVEKLYVPNTLDCQNLFPNFWPDNVKNIIKFNPKYGIENAVQFS